MSKPPTVCNPTVLPYTKLLELYNEALEGHRSDLTLAYGTYLLSRFSKKLETNLSVVLENVYLSALTYRHDGWVKCCFHHLKKSFPKSVRMRRLMGVATEIVANTSEATSVYSDILNSKPEDTLTRKRVAACLKSKGNVTECVKLLLDHLSEYPNDSETWHELGELYLAAGCNKKALFCFEELVLHDPLKVYYLISYAELQLSMGAPELSLKYFCWVLHIDQKNIRALWGIILTIQSSMDSNKHTTKIPNKEPFLTSSRRCLALMAVGKLTDIYTQVKSSSTDVTLSILAIRRLDHTHHSIAGFLCQ